MNYKTFNLKKYINKNGHENQNANCKTWNLK